MMRFFVWVSGRHGEGSKHFQLSCGKEASGPEVQIEALPGEIYLSWMMHRNGGL